MENVQVPKDYTEQLNAFSISIIGPPPGISREHCVDAEAAITADWADDGMGLGFVMFFKPSEEELDYLNQGNLLKVTIRGNRLIPHSLGVWNRKQLTWGM